MSRKTIPLSEFGIDDRYLAHPPEETLAEHADLTLKYFEKIVNVKHLESLIDGLIEKIDTKHFTLIKEMFVNAVYLHDIGKKNPFFQAKKMQNEHFKDYMESSQSSAHSPISAELYIAYFQKKLSDFRRIEKYRLQLMLYSFAYQISKHHGHLSVFEAFKKEDSIAKTFWHYLDKIEIPHFEFYILNKLLFSLLISSDYYATTEYMTKIKTDEFGIFSQEQKTILREKFDTFLQGFGKPTGINKLRNEIFHEAQNTLLKNIDRHIYYLEAPTGSGKTITSINLALTLLNRYDNINKLFYIFPFNTLVEQTKNVFDDIFQETLQTEVINSLTPVSVDDRVQEEEETKYQNAYINRLFYHYPAIITTHVNFFNILFGTSKDDNFTLWQLANSVIIIDEIQSYNNNLWWYMVEFFDKYAALLNMKIIIMSATLPKLDSLLQKRDNFVDLIDPESRDKFFQSPWFKERVKIDYRLLEEGKIDLARIDTFFEEVRGDNRKILFEFIKKQSAREFYNLLKEKYDFVYELSGDDNKAYRQLIINKTKSDQPIIVIATQVIEAGVDIDMDIGFKDISTLDSEEQFMGRINRSCKKSGAKVYFFNKDDASMIYRGDNRLGFDLRQKKYQDILREKNFDLYYHEVLENIKQKGLRFENGTVTTKEEFDRNVQNLNFQEISKTMTLINSKNFTLYFPFKIDLSLYEGVKEFTDIDPCFLTDDFLDGQKVWEKYLKLNTIENFSEQAIKRSHIQSLMQFFTFTIIKYNENSRPCVGEEIGGYYYIADYELFINEGKFDRVAYEQQCQSLFL